MSKHREDDHSGHYHVWLAAGVIYCLERRTVYVDTKFHANACQWPLTDVVQSALFVGLVQLAFSKLGPNLVDAYTWLKPGHGLTGLAGGGHTVTELLKHIGRNK